MIALWVIFTAIAILLSLHVGLVWLDAAFLLPVAALLAFVMRRRTRFRIAIPRKAFLLCLLLGVLLAYPLLLRGVPAAADPAQTITLRVLDERIPPTYAPYADLSFTYQYGFHLFANLFADLLPAPDFLVLWFFGALFGALEAVLLFAFAHALSGKEEAGWGAAILLLGSKAVYRDVLVGGFPTILAVDLLLVTFLAFSQKSRLAYVCFPALAAVHPQIALFGGVLLALYGLLYHRLRRVLLLLPSLVLALPALFTTYAAILSAAGPSFAPSPSIQALLLVPLFIGIVPSAVAALGAAWLAKRRLLSPEKRFALLLLAITVGLYVAMEAAGFQFVARLMEGAIIAAALFGGLTLADLPRHRIPAFAAVLLVGVLATVASGELNELRFDGKLSPEEQGFAAAFAGFDPGREWTFFFTPGGPKIAEYADKIPYDGKEDWFLPYFERQVFPASLQELDQRHAAAQEILAQSCVSCARDLPVRYIVVNTALYSPLPDQPAFSWNDFQVYANAPPGTGPPLA
ncbi:MAG: hypothetical protein HY520_01530 [Candidatus Aenigmarchaeota archaeon]|nr:hypothetical protein [Candidatus Aenigmarchaeota archaeon]